MAAESTGGRICAWFDLLAAKSKVSDESAIALYVDAREVVEKATATTHQHEQTASAVMVLFMDLQMLGEVRNAIG